MWSALLETPLHAALAALAAVCVALAGLGAAIYAVERGEAAAPRATPAPQGRPARHAHLSAAELARLNAFRPRARFMAGEPLERASWRRQVKLAWREGYGGWVIACLLGSFSMATHFGAYWLIAGGGWLGAIAVTLGSTAVMVAACAWVGLGLISGR